MTTLTGPYLRATVLTEAHRLDVVLPADAPVAEVLPAVLDLVEQPAAGTVSMLHTDAGRAIDPYLSLRDCGLRDGAVLRLVAAREAPAEPVVADLIDVLESADGSAGRFSSSVQPWFLATTGAALLVLGSAALANVTGSAAVTLLGAAASGWALTLIAASRRVRPIWFSLAAAAVVLTIGALLTLDAPLPERSVLTLLAAMTSALALGACAGRWRVAAAGAGVLATTGTAATATWLITGQGLHVGAVALVVTVVISGLLPQAALAVSGVFALDTHVLRGDQIQLSQAHDSLAAAAWTLSGALMVSCVLFAVSGALLATHAPGNPWATALCSLLLVLWLSRIRHFPMILQRAAVLAASAAPIVAWVVAVERLSPSFLPWVFAVSTGLGLLLLACHGLPASPLVGAKARRWIRRIEVICVVATVPTLVGLFGIYSDLLDTF
ncbi:hypothetical protein BH23ACT6_BH23ACT6_11070 [soil metagenome]